MTESSEARNCGRDVAMGNEFDNEREFLRETLKGYGIDISEDQVRLLLEHLWLVKVKNTVLNLTRITDAHESVIKHTIDSLLFLKNIPYELIDPRIHFVDVGTGAGFPGIPLSTVSKWNGTLIDSVGKKVDATQEFIQSLGLSNAKAESIRAEELALKCAGTFDLVVARAVADTAVLMEYASPLLRQGGYLCVSKAVLSEDEAEHAQRVCSICGLEDVSRETLSLPEEYGERCILLYRKTRESSIRLPRRTGMATKRPLYLR